jgi:hypothetical protein
MATYVFAFRSPRDRAASPDEEKAWGDWFQSLGGKVTDFGQRVGNVQTVGGDTGERALSGYVLVEAGSLSEAAGLAEGCPGLKSGTQVEVGETIAM